MNFYYRNDDETSSKHGDVDENDEEVRSTKDEDRPSSSGLLINLKVPNFYSLNVSIF